MTAIPVDMTLADLTGMVADLDNELENEMDKYQYRITVNGKESDLHDSLPSGTWDRIAEITNNRTIIAKLERRLVSNYQENIEKMYPGIRCGDLYISLWSTIAELESN